MQKISVLNNVKIIIFIIIPLLLGSLSGFFFTPNEEFKKIKKPDFMPPSIVFQTVWPILYLTIGISWYHAIYNKEITYYIIPVIHFLLNLSFSPIMFGLYNLYGAYIITLLTLITCIIMMIQFFIIDKKYISVLLLFPYVLWLIFATYLAYSIYILNK